METHNMNAGKKKLLYIFDQSDWRSRMPVALGAKAQGYDVTLATIGDGLKINDPVFDQFPLIPIAQPRHKFGPLSVLKTIANIRRLIKDQRPDILHTITLKYAFIVGLARLGLKDFEIIYTIAGLGYLFHGDGLKPRLIRAALSPLLKLVLKNPKARLIFQNEDDRQRMISSGFVRPGNAYLVISSGVDLTRFNHTEEPVNNPSVVLMPTRLVREKGVSIFVEAAKMAKAAGIDARFLIAGGLTAHNPKAHTQEEMDEFTRDGTVEWLGRVDDMPGLLSSANLIVYPSYYGEGVPRVMIEACAAGRAVITTDHTGCRETVDQGISGLLIPIRNASATCEAMTQLLKDNDQRRAMGRASRELAERKFDVNKIVEQTLNVYNRKSSSG